jgi:hypothetical protein
MRRGRVARIPALEALLVVAVASSQPPREQFPLLVEPTPDLNG